MTETKTRLVTLEETTTCLEAMREKVGVDSRINANNAKISF